MIPTLTAVQFTRCMGTGRTQPILCLCEDDSGTSAGAYVVKLRAEVGTRGLLSELTTGRLARHFGLKTPEPALVRIEPRFAELIAAAQPPHGSRIRASIGLNFGSRVVTGFATWLVDQRIPEAMWQVATKVFAFDALIQNPDRRHDNPNLFTRGDAILIYDHETAFSFLLDALPSPQPWKLATERYLRHHVFYRLLRCKPIDLDGFAAALERLSDSAIREVTSCAPPEWNNGELRKIARHLVAMRDHAAEFTEEVRRVLA